MLIMEKKNKTHMNKQIHPNQTKNEKHENHNKTKGFKKPKTGKEVKIANHTVKLNQNETHHINEKEKHIKNKN